MEDKYKLGIKMIDDQHQKIFDLIDRLCDVEKHEKKIVKSVIKECLRHRIILTYEAEAEDMTTDDVIGKIFDSVEVP